MSESVLDGSTCTSNLGVCLLLTASFTWIQKFRKSAHPKVSIYSTKVLSSHKQCLLGCMLCRAIKRKLQCKMPHAELHFLLLALLANPYVHRYTSWQFGFLRLLVVLRTLRSWSVALHWFALLSNHTVQSVCPHKLHTTQPLGIRCSICSNVAICAISITWGHIEVHIVWA